MTEFNDGTLTVTSHRLLWVEAQAPRRALQLPLALVSHLAKDMPGFRLMSSPKIIVYLYARPADAPPGVQTSSAQFIKLSFRRSGGKDRIAPFMTSFQSALSAKAWEAAAAQAAAAAAPTSSGPVLGLLGLQVR